MNKGFAAIVYEWPYFYEKKEPLLDRSLLSRMALSMQLVGLEPTSR